MLVGLIVHARSGDETVEVKLTVPVNPFSPEADMVDEA